VSVFIQYHRCADHYNFIALTLTHTVSSLFRAATTTTYPLQLIKSRMQQREQSIDLTDDGQVRAVKREYRGMLQTARRIYTREGVTGFFKGCIPNAIRVAPGAAVTFVVYEEVTDLLTSDECEQRC
jgi:hypothetical protein